MRSRGPVLTLLAVLAVGVAVFAVNTVLARPADAPAVTAAAQSAPASDPAPQAQQAEAAEAAEVAPAPAPAVDPYGAAPDAAQAPEAAGETPAALPDAFAGRSAGNEVTLAMGREGERVLAYVCDGESIESWFEGTYTDGRLQLSGVDGDLTAEVTEDAVLGTVSVGQKSWPFAAQPEEIAGSATDRAALARLASA